MATTARGRRRDAIRGALLAAVALALWAAAPPAAAHPDRVSGAVVLDASPDLVWQVLTDFEHWPGFVPGLLHLRVLPREDEGVALRHETIRLGYRIDFTARTHVDAQARRLELSLDEDASNDLAAMEASWQVTEIPGGRVRVSFSSTLDSGQPVPRFLERHLLRESVARTVEGFQREVARRAGERRAAADATGSDG